MKDTNIQRLLVGGILLAALNYETTAAIANAGAQSKWQSATIGSTLETGRAEWALAGKQVTLVGSGDGDAGQFVYQSVEGNFELTATV